MIVGVVFLVFGHNKLNVTYQGVPYFEIQDVQAAIVEKTLFVRVGGGRCTVHPRVSGSYPEECALLSSGRGLGHCPGRQ